MIRECWTFDPTPLSKTGNGVKFPGAGINTVRGQGSRLLGQRKQPGRAERVGSPGGGEVGRDGPQKGPGRAPAGQ